MTTVISVENLSKTYRLGQIGTGTFTHDLNLWWAKMRGKPNPMLRIGDKDHGNRDGEELWALKDVSFKVEQGEVLGIIGRNGAGKSTLLKILSRVTAPTSGKIKVKGRIASLLEVGTGFHPELTGRENIYLNGAILGMNRKEIDRKFDEIVDFAEIEKFIDTPVKRYSSGMYVRLAFAVAAHLEPEILVVDEVLAVGDAEFQKKCLGKMGDVAKEGRTVLFVSHDMAMIRTLCRRIILLEGGKIIRDGETSAVIEKYFKENILSNEEVILNSKENKTPEQSNLPIEFKSWSIWDDTYGRGRIVGCNHPCEFRIAYDTLHNDSSITHVDVAITIKDLHGQKLTTGSTTFYNTGFKILPPKGFILCRFENFPLLPGTYTLHLWCAIKSTTVILIENAGVFDVVAEDVYGTGRLPDNKKHGLFLLHHNWAIEENFESK